MVLIEERRAGLVRRGCDSDVDSLIGVFEYETCCAYGMEERKY